MIALLNRPPQRRPEPSGLLHREGGGEAEQEQIIMRQARTAKSDPGLMLVKSRFYFSISAANRMNMVAIWALVALSLGASIPSSIPVMIPFMVIQHMAS